MQRLSAEQLHDAIVQATQVFGNYARSDLVYNTPLPPVRFWTEAATPEEIGNREAKTFLQAFGLANREQFDRQSGGSIVQAMMLMNSAFVTRRVRAEGGSLVEQLDRLVEDERGDRRGAVPGDAVAPSDGRGDGGSRSGGSTTDRTSAEDLQWTLAEQSRFHLQLLRRRWP